VREAAWIASPAHLNRLPEHPLWKQAAPILRVIYSSGGPLSDEGLRLTLARTGIAPVELFGSSESGGIAWRRRAIDDEGRITTKNLVTICAWQYTGAGCVSNYYSTVSGLFTLFTVKVWIPMALILVLKFVGGALIRTILSTVYRKDFEND
jgi:hypothetical protein